MKSKKKLLAFLCVMMLVLVCSNHETSAAWKRVKGATRYYTSKKTYVKSSWYKIKKKWYYFDSKGRLKTGRFKVDGAYYYATKKSGIVKKKKVGKYYYGADGKMVTDTWVKIGKYKFYFGANGKICYGKIKVDGKYYYCDKKYGMLKSQWKNKNYYGDDGVMATNCWINKSYVNENGKITQGDKNPKNPPSASDIRWLSAITYLEAGNQSYYGKKCVASVVINRVNSKRFPNTIKGVLFQSGQFVPAANGTLSALYYSKRSIQAQSVKAAKYVLEHGSVLKGYYYFNIYGGRKKIGDHYFS